MNSVLSGFKLSHPCLNGFKAIVQFSGTRIKVPRFKIQVNLCIICIKMMGNIEFRYDYTKKHCI